MDYKLEDLVDISLLQELQDKLNVIYSFPSAIIDNDGKILTAVAWQDICTKFHRIHPESEKECIKSDQYIMEHLHEANPAVSYKCPHGMTDNATPIIIDGKHLGNFFTGQFFMEKPDLDFFRQQAVKYGFDEKEYIDAVKKVPIWNKKKLGQYLDFIKGFIEIIAGIGLKNLREIETNKALKESDERYRSLFVMAGEGIMTMTTEGKLVEVNESFARMHGYSVDEMLKMSLLDLDTPETAKHIPERMKRILDGENITFEVEHYHKDGHTFCLEVSAGLITYGDKKLIQCFHRDITERKKSQEELTENEKKFRQLYNNTPVMLHSIDKDGRLISVSDFWLNKLGYRRDEVIGRRSSDFLTEESRRYAIEEVLPEYNKTGICQNIEYEFVTKNGNIIDTLLSAISEYDNNGKFIRSLAVITDITEQKKAQQKLKESRERHSRILQTAIDGFWMTDLNGRLLEVNDAYCRMSGYTSEEILSMIIPDLEVNELPEDTEAHIQKVKINGDDRFESRHRRKDGAIFDVEVSVQYQPIDGGRIITFVRDITERKRTEEIMSLIQYSINNARDYIYWIDEDANIKFVNDSACRRLGYFHSEIITKTIFDINPTFIKDKWKIHWKRVLDEKSFTYESQHITKEGEIFPVEITNNFIKYGDKIYNCAITRDITERKKADLELRNERALLENIMETIPVGIVNINIDGGITYANSAAEKILGLSKDQITQRTYNAPNWKITGLNGEAYPEEILPFNMVISTMKPVYDIRHAIQWPNGIRLQLSVNAAPKFDINGILTGVVASIEDITERLNTEVALKQSEHYLRETQVIAELGTYTLDVATGIWNSSEILDEIFGIEKDYDKSVQGWVSIIHPDWQEIMNNYFTEEVIGKKEKFDKEYQIVRISDKSERWVHGIGELKFDTEGNPVLMLGTIKDITERKLAEKELINSRNLLSNLASQVPGVVYQFRLYPDRSSTFPYASPGMNDIYELTPEEVMEDATPVYRRLHPEDKDRVIESILESARSLNTFYCEFRVVLPRQGLRWRWSQATPARTDDGGTLWHGIISDITERKIAEEALKHSHELLRYIIEHNKSAIAIHDRDLNYIYVSQSYLSQYNVLEKNIIGRHHYDIFPDLPQKWRDVHQLALAGIVSSAEDDPYYHDDGTMEWTRWECRPWYLQDETIGGIVVYTEVITDRIKAQEELKKTLLNLNISLEISKAGTWDWDIVNNKFYWSDELYKIFDIDPLAPAGLESWNNAVHPDDREIANKNILDAIEKKVDLRNEYRIISSKGSIIWITSTGKTYYENDKPIRMLGLCMDITERKKAEEELKHSHKLLRYIIEHNRSSIAIHDRDLNYIYVSQSYLRDHNVKEQDVIGKHHYKVFPGYTTKMERCASEGFKR